MNAYGTDFQLSDQMDILINNGDISSIAGKGNISIIN